MALNSVKQMIDAEIEGRVRQYNWRKSPSQTTTAGLWFDLSMSPGNPAPKYWFDASPLVARSISQSSDGGFYHGANVNGAGFKKYLRLITSQTVVATALPMPLCLCDYLLYYPSCDDSTTENQVMDNTVTLSRYTDGLGVQAIAVSVAGRTGGQSFYFTYTNSDGVSGRISQTVIQNAATAIGTIVTSGTATNTATGPFIGLQGNDKGIRSINSITMLGADVGLFSLVLVKPLANTLIRDITAPYEKDFFLADNIVPEIKDDAYLNFLCIPNGTLAATNLIGDMKVIWN